jgi:hypothetical protein
MHPMSAYFATVAPLLMFIASSPLREQLVSKGLPPWGQHPLDAEQFLGDLQRSLRTAFAAGPSGSGQTP